MKHPSKPRAPSKVAKPSKFKAKGRKVGSLSRWYGDSFTLAAAVEIILERTSRKLGIPIEEIVPSQVLLQRFETDIYGPSTRRNPNFDKQQLVYEKNQASLPKRLIAYEKKLRQYEINMKVYEAWRLKMQEDAVQEKMVKIQKELDRIAKKKKELLDLAGDLSDKKQALLDEVASQ